MGMKFDDAWTGPDKIKHLLGGFAISGIASIATHDPVIGLAVGAAVALGKEFIYDLALKKGTCSFQDLVVTLIGNSAASLCAFGILKHAGLV